MAHLSRNQEILAHYNNWIGRPNRVFEFGQVPREAPSPISVLEFAPLTDEYDWVYATVGASGKAMPRPENGSGLVTDARIELVLYSNTQHDELFNLMAKLAIYPFVHRTSFAVGDTIAGVQDVGVIVGSPLTDIFLTHTYSEPPEFETVHHSDGTHTHILFVVPIYASERKIVRERGYEHLEQLFGDKEIDTSDLSRPSVAVP